MADSDNESVKKESENDAKDNENEHQLEDNNEGSDSEIEVKPKKSEIDDDDDDIEIDENVEDEESKENVIPPPKVDITQLYNDPNFATVCSFFNKFAHMAGLKQLTFKKLEDILSTYDNNRVSKELVDLHIQMLRKIRFQHVKSDNWERYLKKYLLLDPHNEEEFLKVERYGYAYIPIGSKVQILKYLCESQIDFNHRLREAILTSCRTTDLRLIPVGTDRHGLSYWYQQDNDCNVRLYTEEADDYSGTTWKLTAQNKEELDELIEKLKSEDLGYDKKLDPLEKQKEKDALAGKPVPVGFSNKKGTYLDTFIGENIIKEMRESLAKAREEKDRKKNEKMKKEQSEESEERDEEVEKEIPEEFLEDRRVLPRRGASLRAVSNMKKVLTPLKRTSSTNDKKKKVEEEKKVEKSSTPSVEESEEDGDDEEEDEGGEEDDDDSEEAASSGDEFKPKSEKKKSKRKRGKKLKKKKKEAIDEMEDEDESDEEEEKKERKIATGDNACGNCKKSTDWEVLLLCDCCDDAWHTYCLKPVLWFVPDGDWFCPKCKHGRLIDRLIAVTEQLEEALIKKVVEDKKKKSAADRLKREMEFIGINYANIIQIPEVVNPAASTSSESDDDGTQRKCKRKAVKKLSSWNNRSTHHQRDTISYSGRRSCRQRTKVDYKGEEFDQMINEAMENIDGAPIKEDKSDENEGGEVVEGEPNVEERKPRPPVKTAKKKTKLNDLDHIPDSDDGGENYNESEPDQSEEEFVEDNESDSDFEDELPVSARRRQPARRTGRRGGKRKRSWSGSSTEESGGEWQSGSDSDNYRKKKKRKQESESEGEVQRTSTGRPLRKAVVKTAVTKVPKVVISDSDGEDEEENAEEDDEDGKKKKASDDEFEVNDEEENPEEEEEDEEEEIEEEESPERAGSGEEEEEEDDEENDDDDSENGSNSDGDFHPKLKRPIQRMAGAPPSSLIGAKEARRAIEVKKLIPKPIVEKKVVVDAVAPKSNLEKIEMKEEQIEKKPEKTVSDKVENEKQETKIEKKPEKTSDSQPKPIITPTSSSPVKATYGKGKTSTPTKETKPNKSTSNVVESPYQISSQPQWPPGYPHSQESYPPRPYVYPPLPMHTPYGLPPTIGFKGNGLNDVSYQPSYQTLQSFPPVSNPYASNMNLSQQIPNPYGALPQNIPPPATDDETKPQAEKYLTL